MSVLTLLLVSLIIFAVLEVLPGDVATRILGRDATPESLAAAARAAAASTIPPSSATSTGSAASCSGDFGNSLTSARPVVDILAPRIFNTAAAVGSTPSSSTCRWR